ncbi:deadenylation complex subunit pan3 [Anaeramoeba flamelloides]|uniref:Deadenylation complex subunit pan3 n=1 Tax=Anaeramoeba flamelloides TaxID=1746091 RepID=A0AAV7YQ32_9EUKA|nr:deadenylation complex subunit pan3 [Anaeramoeba flamelloides]
MSNQEFGYNEYGNNSGTNYTYYDPYSNYQTINQMGTTNEVYHLNEMVDEKDYNYGSNYIDYSGQYSDYPSYSQMSESKQIYDDQLFPNYSQVSTNMINGGLEIQPQFQQSQQYQSRIQQQQYEQQYHQEQQLQRNLQLQQQQQQQQLQFNQKQEKKTTQRTTTTNKHNFKHQNRYMVSPNLQPTLEMKSQFRRKDAIFPFDRVCFRATNENDGYQYAASIIHNSSLTNGKEKINVWKSIKHPNIITFHEAFDLTEFKEISTFFIYDYHPNAKTLEKHHIIEQNTITEQILWKYIVQLVTAIKYIHSKKLTCENLTPSKILIIKKRFHRIKLNYLGLPQILMVNSKKSLKELQEEDLISLGKTILSLICGVQTIENLNDSIKLVLKSNYSTKLKDLIKYLLMYENSQESPTIGKIVLMINDEILNHLETVYQENDLTTRQLEKEVDNGQILNLLFKLLSIVEKPNLLKDKTWSTTGNRLLLQLFKDSCFHQVDENNVPVIDYSHVMESLKKLDAGLNENLLLYTKDEKSLFVVTYNELKDCLEKSFEEKKQEPKKTKQQSKVTFSADKLTEFSIWYENILEYADIVDKRYPIKGMPVFKPYGCFMQTKTMDLIEKEWESQDIDRVKFPTMIPETFFK